MSKKIHEARQILALVSDSTASLRQRWLQAHDFMLKQSGISNDQEAADHLVAMADDEIVGDRSEAELAEELLEVQENCQRIIDREIDRILSELNDDELALPVNAILETREHRDLLIPLLIESLREAASRTRAGHDVEGGLHFLALFLLSEFQVQEALPAVLEAISLPGEQVFDLFGDAVTESFPTILAGFCIESRATLLNIILDKSYNEYVRWSAALAYIYLVFHGRVTRQAAVEELRSPLRVFLDQADRSSILHIISTLAYLAPREATAEIDEAYDRNLMDVKYIDRKSLQEKMDDVDNWAIDESNRFSSLGIEDTVEELQRWASYSEEREEEREPEESPPVSFDTRTSNSTSIVNDRPYIGRNDPCYCGSGKKFKKCCGRN